MSTSSTSTSFLLYSDHRSSCAARLRIALNLKAIPYDLNALNLAKDEQLSPLYTALNPSASVPTLIDRNQLDLAIGQSVAALEYLEDVFPRHFPLMPPTSDPIARAHVRTLVEIIVSDTQPVTNKRLHTKLRAESVELDSQEWNKHWFRRGMAAYEEVARRTAGTFSVGGQPTLADVVLVPAVWNCEKAGIGIEELPPTVKRVYESMMKEAAVEKAHWRNQPDYLEEQRVANSK